MILKTATKRQMLRYVLSKGSLDLTQIVGIQCWRFTESDYSQLLKSEIGANYITDSCELAFDAFIQKVYTVMYNSWNRMERNPDFHGFGYIGTQG